MIERIGTLAQPGLAVRWVPVALALLGLFRGGYITSLTSLVGQSAPRERRGAAYGAFQSADSSSDIAASSLGGVVAATVGLRAVFALGGAVFLALAVGVGRLSGVVQRAAGERMAPAPETPS